MSVALVPVNATATPVVWDWLQTAKIGFMVSRICSTIT